MKRKQHDSIYRFSTAGTRGGSRLNCSELHRQHLTRTRRHRDMKTLCVSSATGRLAAVCACFTSLALGADPALTIYNQNFAVIRETLPLDLKAGNNTVRFSGATAHVEPDSVILRDPAGRRPCRCWSRTTATTPCRKSACSICTKARPSSSPCEIRTGAPARHRQDRPQRLCAALPGDEPLRRAISGQPDGDGRAIRRRRAAHYRGGRKAAVLSPGTADLPSAGRRHDPHSRLRLDPVFRAAGPLRCRAELCFRRHELEQRLQHRRAGDRRYPGTGGLGDVGQPERQAVRPRPHQADGGRRE